MDHLLVSNNNYASREKCKKCGEPKEVAAMPAIAMPGASLPTYAHYFARAHGGPGFKMNFGITGSSTLQHPLPANANWLLGGANKCGLHQTATWPLVVNNVAGFSYANNPNQLPMVPKGWRSGDWMCHCGFHNYSSRSQPNFNVVLLNQMSNDRFPNMGKGKVMVVTGGAMPIMDHCVKDVKALAVLATFIVPSMKVSPSLNFGRSPHSTLEDASKHGTHSSFPALGTKRLASEEFVNEWDNKRLNAGDIYNQALPNVQQRSFQGYEHIVGSSNAQTPGLYTSYPNASSGSTAVTPADSNANNSWKRVYPCLRQVDQLFVERPFRNCSGLYVNLFLAAYMADKDFDSMQMFVELKSQCK
ncbi:hypothetical protein ACLOJK_027929 [Asimina triloba]